MAFDSHIFWPMCTSITDGSIFALPVDHCFVSVISVIIIEHYTHRLFSERACFASPLSYVTKEITLNWANDFQVFIIASMCNMMTSTTKDIVSILFKKKRHTCSSIHLLDDCRGNGSTLLRYSTAHFDDQDGQYLAWLFTHHSRSFLLNVHRQGFCLSNGLVAVADQGVELAPTYGQLHNRRCCQV